QAEARLLRAISFRGRAGRPLPGGNAPQAQRPGDAAALPPPLIPSRASGRRAIAGGRPPAKTRHRGKSLLWHAPWEAFSFPGAKNVLPHVFTRPSKRPMAPQRLTPAQDWAKLPAPVPG